MDAESASPAGADYAAGMTSPNDSDAEEAAPIQITAATTTADVLASLRRQGISDLEEFVEKLVSEAKAKAEEDQGEDDDVWRLNLIVHDHYVLTYGGVSTEQAPG
jgi:hypothetical protein